MRLTRIAVYLLTIAILVVGLTADASAGCKWFKVCGFTENSPVIGILSYDINCITVDNIPAVTDGNGCVTFRVCCVLAECGCSTTVEIKVDVPGTNEHVAVNFECVDFVTRECLPTVRGCVDDPTQGGDTSSDAFDVTACAFLSPVEPAHWSTIKALYRP